MAPNKSDFSFSANHQPCRGMTHPPKQTGPSFWSLLNLFLSSSLSLIPSSLSLLLSFFFFFFFPDSLSLLIFSSFIFQIHPFLHHILLKFNIYRSSGLFFIFCSCLFLLSSRRIDISPSDTFIDFHQLWIFCLSLCRFS